MAEDLRYPVGRFVRPALPLSDEARTELIERIARMPNRLRASVDGLSGDQLDTPYRPEGWTVRQLVHHLPDSHLNAYVRFKLALTEEVPTIKTYDEAAWAELEDSRATPPDVSLRLLEALHERWTTLLRGMSASQFARGMSHPDLGVVTLDLVLALYAWHGDHHVGHITALREREGWG